MKITIFGTWYAGLVTGTCLAEVGHEVLCIDVDTRKIESLKKWNIPIYEPGLQELVSRNMKSGRLSFSTDAKQWILFWKAIFNAVGTPPDKDNANTADLKYIKEVAKTFWKYINEYKIFINKSTVPVWTGEMCHDIIKKSIYKREKNIEFDVVSNPEFLQEWRAVKDFLVPDRIVVGTQSEKSERIMKEIYKPLEKEDVKILFTDIKSAEIIKYAANAFLATKISFINDIANFSETVWGDIADISLGLGMDKRIGKSFLSAGIWYGGSCLPKDVKALIETGKQYNYDFQIVAAADRINEKQKIKTLDLLAGKHESVTDLHIAIWGLSFKPNTDDTRDSAARFVMDKLMSEWVKHISTYDPIALSYIEQDYSTHENISFHENAYDALAWADVLILLTEWDEFRAADFKKIKKHMKGKLIIDGRNIWDKSIEDEYDLEYISIGR
jgi:UDPglucose 6-dehydrogenase